MDENPYGFEADIWAFGIILTELAQLKYPYEAEMDEDDIKMREIKACNQVNQIKNNSPKSIPNHYSDNYKNFVTLLLEIGMNIKSDPKISNSLLEHVWMLKRTHDGNKCN